MKLATAEVDLVGNTSGLGSFERAARSMENMGARLTRQFTTVTDSTLSWRGALGLVAGATGLALAARKVFELGAAVGETQSKFDTVFGSAAEGVQGFIDQWGTMAGLTDEAAQGVLATTGAIVQGMGYAQAASAEFAVEVVRLAGDLASFNNVPIADTARAIQAALTGERESLKRLGVVLLETDVQRRALVNTGKANVESLTQEEKATASLQLITERAGVAIGDLERTQDSAANRSRRVTAEILNLRDGLAVALLPALDVVLGAIGDSTGGMEGFTSEMQRQGPVIAGWANFAVAAFKTVGTSIAAVGRIAFNTGQIMGESALFFSQVARLQFGKAAETFRSSVGNMGDMADAIDDVVVSFGGMQVASAGAWSTMAAGARDTSASLVGVPPLVDEVTGAIAKVPEKVVAMTASVIDLKQAAIDMLAGMKEKGEALAVLFAEAASSASEMAGRMKEKAEALATSASNMGDVLADITRDGVSAFADFATGAGDAIGRFVQRAMADLARLIARLLIVRALKAAFAGSTGGIGGFVLGALEGKASGGPVSAGTPYVVGERGPELFVPSSSGAIVPNHQMGGPSAASIMAALGPLPRPMTPSEVARDAWYREFIRLALVDNRQRVGG